MSIDVDGERGTQAVHRALRMLESFANDRPELSLSELAEAAHLTLPTAHRIARTLHARGFLVQTDPERSYSLGPAVMRLARTLLLSAAPHNLVRLVQPHLERLRDETEETAALHCTVDDQRICVSEVPSAHAMRMANGVGNLYPLHSGAAGKAILARLPPADADAILREHPDAARLRRELARIRRQGYALSMGETVPSAAAIAATIRGPEGRVVGAVSLAGPIERWTRDKMVAAAPLLVSETDAITAAINAGVG
jgi:IclR family acetate operon transcriptional repressor